MSAAEYFEGLSYFEKLKALGEKIDTELTNIKNLQDMPRDRPKEENSRTTKRLADLFDEAVTFRNETLKFFEDVKKTEKDTEARLQTLKCRFTESSKLALHYVRHLQQYGLQLPPELQTEFEKAIVDQSSETFTLPQQDCEKFQPPVQKTPVYLRKSKAEMKENVLRPSTPIRSASKSKIPSSNALYNVTPTFSHRSLRPHKASLSTRADVSKKYQEYLQKDDEDCTVTELMACSSAPENHYPLNKTPQFSLKGSWRNVGKQKVFGSLRKSKTPTEPTMSFTKPVQSKETPEEPTPSRQLPCQEQQNVDRTPSPPVLRSLSYLNKERTPSPPVASRTHRF